MKRLLVAIFSLISTFALSSGVKIVVHTTNYETATRTINIEDCRGEVIADATIPADSPYLHIKVDRCGERPHIEMRLVDEQNPKLNKVRKAHRLPATLKIKHQDIQATAFFADYEHDLYP